VPRRLILLGLLAVLAPATGCCHLRERIAWRWHQFHGHGCGPVCTPAFRIPSPPVRLGPVVGGPVSAGPVAGCATCQDPVGPGPVAFAGPVAFPAPVAYAGPVGSGYPAYPTAPPVITGPTPILPSPQVLPNGGGVPSPMPPSTPKN
jgi:hypothetical protein